MAGTELLFLLDPPGPLAKDSGADGKPARMTGLPIFYDRGNTLYGPQSVVWLRRGRAGTYRERAWAAFLWLIWASRSMHADMRSAPQVR